MLAEQDGVCGACGRAETITRAGNLKTLAVDHDHGTGRVRGLLCGRCNTALGLLGDDPALIRLLLDYLTSKATGKAA